MYTTFELEWDIRENMYTQLLNHSFCKYHDVDDCEWNKNYGLGNGI